MTAKFLAAALLGLVLLAALAGSVFGGEKIFVLVVTATARLRGLGAAGWALFIAAEFAITLVGIVPGSLLGLAAGAVYGIGAGFCAAAIGIFAGAIAAFALSRSMLRPLIAGLLARGNRLAALDGLLTQQSWRIVALLRISPVMPFSITSYALGLSGIVTRDYVLGTLASLPPLLGYVVIGALGGQGLAGRSAGNAAIHAALLALGAIATLALTLHLSRLLAKAFKTTGAAAPYQPADQ
jgi:uncharacterized membrane protein YdjX (TVP38/TMEM64 family)